MLEKPSPPPSYQLVSVITLSICLLSALQVRGDQNGLFFFFFKKLEFFFFLNLVPESDVQTNFYSTTETRMHNQVGMSIIFKFIN